MGNDDTINLWQQIKRMGNFSDKYYDVSIINDLEEELSIASDFETSLKDIPSETFLMAFFKVMSPLVSMYADILNFFERCKAHSATENIEIEFDLKRFKSTRINATHFMKAKEQLVKVKQVTQKKLLFPEGIGILSSLSIPQGLVDESINDECFFNWSQEYYNQKEWPSTQLDFASAIEGSPIQEPLSKAFLFWSELFVYYQSVPTSRDKWYEFINSRQDQSLNDFSYKILMPEVDLCLGRILHKLYYLAENYTNLSPDMKQDVDVKLYEFLEHFPSVNDFAETLMPVWKSFLNLPVWKRRYEVYSVWVFTQAIADFPDEALTFHLKDGVLSFPFSGACLATVKLNHRVFDFWTELRTKAIVKPIGKSRKTAIQPDYSIICGDSANIVHSIAVIECKQYKRSHTVNFSQAILDYAYNRPNAKVFLVDYGEIDIKSLMSKLQTLSAERYEAMSRYRPEIESSKPLSHHIRELVYQHAKMMEMDLNDIAYFSLFWDKGPLDLDLYLCYQPNASAIVRKACYNANEIDGVQYNSDIRDGYGPEKICVKKWHKGIYDLWVNNSSKTPIFFQGNTFLSVVFQGTNQTLQIECPKTGAGPWWHILRIDTISRTVTIINKYEMRGGMLHEQY